MMAEIQPWTAIAGVIQALVTLLTAFVALWGLNNWFREFKAKRDIELCEEVLEKFYRAQEAIRAMRSPGIFSGEAEASPQKSSESEPGNSQPGAQQLYLGVLLNRYKSNQELFSNIQALRHRFMARFGADQGRPFEELHRALNRLFSSARMLDMLHARHHLHKDPNWRAKQANKIEEHEKIIYWMTPGEGGEDEYDQNLTSIIGQIEATCRERTARKEGFWQRFRRK